MKSLGNIKGFVYNLVGLTDDTEPLRKRFKCNRVYDDFSSDEEVPTLRSKLTLGSKTIKLNLLNKEKRKPIKSSTMKASSVLQMLSKNKELSVTRTPTTVQPVADEEMAGCSRRINVNISITPAEVIKSSKRQNEIYDITSDDEIDSNFSRVNDTDNINDTKMVERSSIDLEENENTSQKESFEEWLKKFNAEHKAYMERSRKSIHDILQKYASVSKVCADNETPRSSTYEDWRSESDANFNKTDSTSNNKSIDPHPGIENNLKPLNESNLTTDTEFKATDVAPKTPDNLDTGNTKQNVADSFKSESFDEWISKIKSKYKINLQIPDSTASNTLTHEETLLQFQLCKDMLRKHKPKKSQVIDSNEDIVINNKQNLWHQPSCSKDPLTHEETLLQLQLCRDMVRKHKPKESQVIDSNEDVVLNNKQNQCKKTVQESVENPLSAPQKSTIASKENDETNSLCSSEPDLISPKSSSNSRLNRLEADLIRLQNSIEQEIESKLKNDLTETTETKENDEDQKTLDLPDITLEQEELINTALKSPPDQVLIEKFKLKIYTEDLETLSEDYWLNDKVIDFYMNLIMQRSEEQHHLAKVYSMNTLFYPKLMKSGHAGLKRWTRKVDIFAYDLLVIPVHLTNHWCVSFINFRTRKIEYLDSRGKSQRNCLIALLQYLKDEHLDKKGVPFDDSGWETECLKDIPEQLNSSDCGIFVCTFAEFSSRNAAYTFTQAHMPYLRRKAALEILTGKLLL